jgi:c-di-GMP-binding flagellar brake protein YcgR
METIRNEAPIPIGEPCQIQIGQGKYSSVFRGHNYPKHILLDGPVSRGTPIVSMSGVPYVVRFVYNGLVYGFESVLLKQYTNPVNLWAMKYPDEIQVVNLRKSLRIATFIPASFNSGGTTVTGAFVDISEGGGLFKTPGKPPFEPGQTALVNMTLPNGDSINGLGCKICSVKPNGSKVSVGINFDLDDPAASQKIKAFYLMLLEVA